MDFGREVYTAWRLSAGELLYRDVASLFGPLAPYADAAAFTVIGPSLDTMLGLNALLIAAAVGIVYTFLSRISHRLVALVGSLTFMGVFAFGLLGSPNYNFLTPYSRAAVWGVVLGMAAVTCLERWLVRPADRKWALGAGLFAGATLLTKPEVAFAVVGSVTLASGLARMFRSVERRSVRAGLASLLAGMALPLVLTFLAFWIAGSASLGLEALIAPYRPLFSEDPLSMTFYQHWLGLSEPLQRTGGILGATALLVGVFVGLGLVDRPLSTRSGRWTRSIRLLVLLGLVVCATLLSVGDDLLLRVVPSATPVLLLGALVWFTRSVLRSAPGIDQPRTVAFAVWLTFSLLLFLKLGLRPRFSHYGFYLAAPGGVALAVILVELVPKWTGHLVGASRLSRLGGIALLGALALASAAAGVTRNARAERVQVGSGADALLPESELAPGIERVLSHLKESTAPDATLAVLPEGATLNYWSRRINPTPFVSFMPPELAFYGAERMSTVLETARPDVIVLWNRSLSEYGAERFGASPATGSAILRFVRRNYESVATIPADREQNVFEILTRTH